MIMGGENDDGWVMRLWFVRMMMGDEMIGGENDVGDEMIGGENDDRWVMRLFFCVRMMVGGENDDG